MRIDPIIEPRASLEVFSRQREELLASLKALTLEDWSGWANFTGTTRGKEQTVFSYAERIAQHEAGHLQQLEELLRTP